jgi:hypothetical protein
MYMVCLVAQKQLGRRLVLIDETFVDFVDDFLLVTCLLLLANMAAMHFIDIHV